MLVYLVYVYSSCRDPELKHLKIFNTEKAAIDFANHYAIDNSKYYFNESLIQGTFYDQKFYCFDDDEYDCEISEKDFQAKIEKSNQLKAELRITSMKCIRIAIDKVEIE